MSKRDTWLTTFAFIASVMPIMLMAFIIKLLPTEVPIVELDPSVGYASKYNNLMVILFSVVPLFIVVLTRFVKKRDSEARTMPMLLVAISIGLIFSGIVLYGGIGQLQKVELNNRFDYIGFFTVVISLTVAVLSNVVRFRESGQFLSINNKFTRSSKRCWNKVHNVAADVQSIVFVSTAIILAFTKSWSAVVVFVAALILFLLWLYCYSYLVHKKLDKNIEVEY